ncbi:hypothetical protein [Enterococcus rotai]|uniref:hypothetical protein n=1 Tax=Enterococcus rotai TaxID=118060 RepID=UPI0032B53B6D
MVDKSDLKKKGVCGLSISLLIFLGAYVQQDREIKAMPNEESVIDLANTNIEKVSQLTDSTPKVGWFEDARESVNVDNIINISYNTVWINTSEIISKTSEEIIQDVEAKLDLVVDHQSAEARVSDISAIKEDSLGLVDIDAEVKIDTSIYHPKIKILVVPNGLFTNDDGMNWKNLALKSSEGIIENPINESKAGFPERGVTPRIYSSEPITYTDILPTDIGFQVVDKTWKGYAYGKGDGYGLGRSTAIPLYNDDTFYSKAVTTNTGRYNYIRLAGIGSPGIGSSGGVNGSKKDMKYGYDWYGNRLLDDRMFIDKKYFLRSGDGKRLKEILLDTKRQVCYVYDLTMSKNLNFYISLSMYNLSSEPKKFALVDLTDTDYRSDKVAIYPLANNEGFYFAPDQANRFTVKLKKNGEWLSDYQKYKTADYRENSNALLFGLDSSGTGHELEVHNDLTKPLLSGVDSMFQLGTPAKMIEPGEAIVGAYEMFVGSEIDYMSLEITPPNNYDVYNNQLTRKLTNGYTLTKIPDKPTGSGKGNIHIVYPNGEDKLIPFVSEGANKSEGTFDIELDRLPNNDVGTIKQNTINILGVIEGDATNKLDGLPSNDAFVKVNVYNFGGTAQLQHVLQNSTWTKEAKELIVNPVALPNHPIDYEYEDGEIPDTSKLGVQWIGVRMTDRQDKTQSKVIKVPILVDKDSLGEGLWLNAEDVYIESTDVAGQSKNKIKELILDKSHAMGIDLSNKTMDGVTLEVVDTDLTGRPDDTRPEPYKATITASKSGLPSVSKEIKIYLVKEPVIDAQLEVAKPEIRLGEKNTYTATFKDKAPNPTKLLDVVLGTAALPDFVTLDVDSFRVKIGDGEEKLLNPQDIISDPGGSFDIKLNEIPAGAQVTVTFDFLTSMDVPPPSFDEYDAMVEFDYLFKARRADGKPVPSDIYSNLTEFLVLEPTSAIEINYLMEGTNTPIPNEYTKAMSGNIGDESDLLEFSIDNYVLSKVQFDGKDQVLPTQAFKVKFGDVEKITFYYKGVLKIKSAPTAYDFGLEVSSSKKIRVDNPTPIGMPFIVADTRTSSPGWSLKVKLTEELLNDDGKTTLKNAVRYKSGKTETILNNQAIKVVQKVNPGEYDVSKDWSATGDGLKLEIAPGAVNALGKYHGEILFELGETP